MNTVTPSIVFMVVISVLSQVYATYLLPLTRGLTHVPATIGAAVAFLLAMGLMARLVHAGVNLGLLVPIMASTVPICAIVMGILFYGESASLMKIGALFTACLLIALANFF